jgi:type I restriction enzyme, S subunit
MSDLPRLPSSWTEVTIDVLLEPLSDGRLLHHGWSPQCEAEPSPSDDEWGVLKTTAIQDGLYLEEHNKRLPETLSPRPDLEVKSGDILLTCAGPRNRCGVPCLVRHTRPRLILSGQMYRFRVLETVMNAAFLEAYLRAKDTQSAIDVMKTGISDSGLNLTHGRFFRLKVPVAPLNEQRRIVAKIEELFSDLAAGVAALERAKANLKRYRASVLKAAVEGKLTEAWRAEHPNTEPASKLLERILAERRQKWEADQLAKFVAAEKEPPKNWKEKYAEPTLPVTTGLPELPERWCWATLGQLLHGIEGGKSFKCETRPAVENEWGVIKVSAMTWGTFLEAEQKAIPPDSRFDPSDEIKPNDLLLSRSNTSQLVGATVLVGNCRPRLLLSDKSLRLKMSNMLDRRWLHRALSSSVARRQLSAMATGTSDSMRNVSQEKIESVVLPLPPLCEQEEIVAEIEERISVTFVGQEQVDHGLRRAALLRQCILKHAFEGKLVPQDPNDERASVLLERLRAIQHVHEGNGKPATPARPRGRRSTTKQKPGRAEA